MDVPHSVDDDDAQRSAKLIQRLWRGRFARTDLSASDALWRLANVITEASTKEDGMVGTPGKRKRDFRRQHSQRDTKNEPKSPTRARDRPLVKQPWSTVSVARRLSLRKANSLSKKSLSQSSMSQSNGDLGVARTIDDLLVAPLVYRLVSLNADKAWGTGKLVQLAEKSNSDEQLAQEISVLLPKLWRDDPIRTSVLKQQQDGKLDTGICSGETWADVLLEGRGTVGETVLHLVFLLNTPACRRLVRFLVPYLAHKRTTDVFGHKVIDPPTLLTPLLRPMPLTITLATGVRSRRHLPGSAILWRGGRPLRNRARGPADAQAARFSWRQSHPACVRRLFLQQPTSLLWRHAARLRRMPRQQADGRVSAQQRVHPRQPQREGPRPTLAACVRDQGPRFATGAHAPRQHHPALPGAA
jgi:hypothetical protein